MSKLISAIMPIYNSENRLALAIDSVLNQTYKNFELILIDDGSTDKSNEICDMYAKKDERILVVHKENGGVSSARNVGLDKASGDIVSFIDSDDTIDSSTFYNIDKVFSNFNVDSMCFKLVEENNNQKKEYSNIFDEGVLDRSDVLNAYLTGKITGWMCVWALDRKLIDSSFRFNTRLSISEDYTFISEIICKSNKIYFLNKELYNYFINDESACRNPKKYVSNLNGYINSYVEVLNILNKYSLINDTNKTKLATSRFNHIVWHFNRIIKYSLIEEAINELFKNENYIDLVNNVDVNIKKRFNRLFLFFSKKKMKKMLVIICHLKKFLKNIR